MGQQTGQRDQGQGSALIEDDGTEGVERERRLAARALRRSQVHAVIRARLKDGSSRDLAIVQVLRCTIIGTPRAC